jgi:hypothetical protein
MASADELGKLQSAQWEDLQEQVSRLEQAHKKAKSSLELGEIEDFLPPASDPKRIVYLYEMIKTDLEIRWRSDQNVGLEQYLEKFPELGPVAILPASLIYEEYRVRQLYGDRPPVSSYASRFPEQLAELKHLIADQPLPTATAVAKVRELTPVSPAPAPAPPLAPEFQPTLERQKPPDQQETLPPHEAAAAKPAAAAAPGTGEILPSGHKKLKFLGRGGFGEVWRGEAPGGVPCAIKIINRPIDSDEAKRELESLELIKSLRHPFLLQTQSYFQLEDRLLIVM